MKSLLLSNWTFLRALRLLLGVAFLISAYMQMAVIPVIIGGMFLYQSIMNIGCAGGVCYSPAIKKQSNTAIQDVDYEEIK